MARVLMMVALVGAFVLWQVQHCERVESQARGAEIAERTP